MERIPLTILGGSDLVAGPAEGPTAGLHPLACYKGAHLRIGGRPLAALLAQRLLATGGFGPVRVAGPARVYAQLCPELEIVDTDSSVGANLRAAIEHHRSQSAGALALAACDVLPSVEELRELRAEYERARPCALWFPLVLEPTDKSLLGAFAWKPSYRIAPARGEPALAVLPGHLAIFQPDALRLPLIHRLLDSAYRARNRSLLVKRAAMLRAVLWGLLATDARLLARLRAPTRTASTLAAGLRIVRELRRGELTLSGLEGAIGQMLLRRSQRRRSGAGGVRLPLVRLVSLATDIDTLEEAHAVDRLELSGG